MDLEWGENQRKEALKMVKQERFLFKCREKDCNNEVFETTYRDNAGRYEHATYTMCVKHLTPDLILEPFSFLQTKWIYAKESIPKRLLTFLGLSNQDLVARKEDVVKAIQIAYSCGFRARELKLIKEVKDKR